MRKSNTERTVATIKSYARRDIAVDDARRYLVHNLRLMTREHIHKDDDEATVRLYRTVLDTPNGRNDADEWITTMMSKARAAGDDSGLCAIAASIIAQGEPLPESLRGWCAEVLKSRGHKKPRGKRGPDPVDRVSRNGYIIRAVCMVARKYGFEKTRNRDARSEVESGCSIVTKALAGIGISMSEENVEKIVEKA